jgi:hypothetical protein
MFKSQTSRSNSCLLISSRASGTEAARVTRNPRRCKIIDRVSRIPGSSSTNRRRFAFATVVFVESRTVGKRSPTATFVVIRLSLRGKYREVVAPMWYRFSCIEYTPFSSYAGVPMMESKRTEQPLDGRWLTIGEIRLVSDLRIMHAKVDELYHLVHALKHRHDEPDIVKYADQPILTADIQMVDEIYLWFVKLKEESIAQRT